MPLLSRSPAFSRTGMRAALATAGGVLAVLLGTAFLRLTPLGGLPKTDEGVYAYAAQAMHASVRAGHGLPDFGTLTRYPLLTAWLFDVQANHLLLRCADLVVALAMSWALYRVLVQESGSRRGGALRATQPGAVLRRHRRAAPGAGAVGRAFAVLVLRRAGAADRACHQDRLPLPFRSLPAGPGGPGVHRGGGCGAAAGAAAAVARRQPPPTPSPAPSSPPACISRWRRYRSTSGSITAPSAAPSIAAPAARRPVAAVRRKRMRALFIY